MISFYLKPVTSPIFSTSTSHAFQSFIPKKAVRAKKKKSYINWFKKCLTSSLSVPFTIHPHFFLFSLSLSLSLSLSFLSSSSWSCMCLNTISNLYKFTLHSLSIYSSRIVDGERKVNKIKATRTHTKWIKYENISYIYNIIINSINCPTKRIRKERKKKQIGSAKKKRSQANRQNTRMVKKWKKSKEKGGPNMVNSKKQT